MSDLCRVKYDYFLKISHKPITRATYEYTEKSITNLTQIYNTIMDCVTTPACIYDGHLSKFCQVSFWKNTILDMIL